MAPFPSTKPETVLKQADGLVAVGQHEAALQSLTEMFAAKKFRNTPLSSLEPIMMRFIQLCVDLRQGRTAKEGLMQYKNIAQNSSVASIENVIKKFIALCDAKVQEAQEQASKVVGLGDVDDLEASETPESILLGAVSGDQSKDRTDRALVTPWLKFLWEAYRTALETLKNNNRLEAIYQQIVHQAFKFCIKHNRKVEFRRLCETLRLHLANVAKYAHQTHSINLSDPDTLQSHLDARFAQLNTSVELELWQEAFRSVEDVHNLLTLAKKAPRPQMMANYYEKLARIFLMSGSALFHAAAWSRYNAVVKAAGGKTDEEMSKLAGLVLVSALAVPLGVEGSATVDGSGAGAEETKGRNARLTALIGLSKMPTRTGLLKEALSRNTLKASPEPIRQLYQILEVDSHPLTLCSTAAPVLQSLSTDSTYSPYLPLLHKVLLSRLLMQLSEVYSSVKISHVLELVAPLNAGPSTAAATTEDGQAVTQIHYDHPHIEAFVMGCAQRGELQVRVDHAQGSVTFAAPTFSSTTPGLATPSTAVPDIRHRLSRLVTSLSESISYISPPAAQAPSEEQQQQALSSLVEAANEERARLALNRTLAARRVELLAELTARRNKEESSRKLEATRRAQEEEERRVAELKKQREREMIQLELESVKKQEAKKLAETLLEKGTLKVDVKQLEDLDSDRLLQLQVEQLDKEKRELQDRLRIISRRLDHSERAFRREEKPLLAEDYAKQQASDRKAYDAYVKTTLQTSKEQHEESIRAKKRLSRMTEDYRVASEQIAGKRGAEYHAKKEAAKNKMFEEMNKRRDKILKERREEDEQREAEERARREQEEEEARRAEEAAAAEDRRLAEEAAAREETERKKAEADAALAEKRKEREAERQKDLELARRRQQLEEEAEARRLKRGAAPAAAEPQGVWRTRDRGTATPTSTPTPGSSAIRTPGGAYRPPGARGATEGTSTPTPTAPPPVSVASTRVPSAPVAGGPPVIAPRAGGWRDRVAAKESGSGAASNGRNSPAPGSPKASTPKPLEDQEGFQPVPTKTAWKPKFRRDGQ